ncbi:MAG: hypothetical protein U0528_03955 [Anaerolineae bacterium]|nr:hypothetical protein [Anaerolineae bacterium]
MTPFDYVSLLVSIVIALGITRVLTDLGNILQLRRTIRLYWVHVLWLINVLLWLLLDWWILYRWRTFEQWNFFLFLFVLVSPVIAFLLALLLRPEVIQRDTDLKQHFYENNRWFFSLSALLPVVDAFDTLLKGWDHFVAQGPIYIITLSLIFVLCVIGARTKDERYHAAFAIFFLVYLLVFITINLRMLV